VAQDDIIIFADELEKFRIGLKLWRQVEGPRFGEGLGIVHRDLKLHVSETQPLSGFFVRLH